MPGASTAVAAGAAPGGGELGTATILSSPAQCFARVRIGGLATDAAVVVLAGLGQLRNAEKLHTRIGFTAADGSSINLASVRRLGTGANDAIFRCGGRVRQRRAGERSHGNGNFVHDPRALVADPGRCGSVLTGIPSSYMSSRGTFGTQIRQCKGFYSGPNGAGEGSAGTQEIGLAGRRRLLPGARACKRMTPHLYGCFADGDVAERLKAAVC